MRSGTATVPAATGPSDTTNDTVEPVLTSVPGAVPWLMTRPLAIAGSFANVTLDSRPAAVSAALAAACVKRGLIRFGTATWVGLLTVIWTGADVPTLPAL